MSWNDYLEGYQEPELLTDEEIELLLEDVSGRLPYGVIAQFEHIDEDHDREDFVVTAVDLRNQNLFWCGGTQLQEKGIPNGTTDIAPRNEYFKPYLRKMSTMTKDEMKDLKAGKYELNKEMNLGEIIDILQEIGRAHV